MKYYYVNTQGKTEGPATLEQIQELVRNGQLKNDPMVIPDGGTNWKALSAVLEDQPKSAAPEPS